MAKSSLKKKLLLIYQRLYEAFGPQHWWPGETPFEVIIGAILTQSAAWSNVEKAIANLKREGLLEPSALQAVPLERLASLLYPSGYYNAKAQKVKAFVQHLGENHNHSLDSLFAQDTPDLRRELLGIFGIGEETADSIILYAARKPSFVVDAYTRRILHRLGIAPSSNSYSAFQSYFQDVLPRDADLFNEYHALLVRLGKEVCRKEPCCHRCPLRAMCPTGSTEPEKTS